VGKSFARVVCKDYKFNVPQGVYLENGESYLGFNFDTHSLVEPLLAIDKIKNCYT
jgi:hypothetical protein